MCTSRASVANKECSTAQSKRVCKSLVGNGELILQEIYYYTGEAFTTRKIPLIMFILHQVFKEIVLFKQIRTNTINVRF